MKKFTSIRVFDDDEVVQHILSKEGHRNGKKSNSKFELEYNLNKRRSHEDNLFEDDETENLVTPGLGAAMDVDGHDSFYGSDMYKFKGLKKAGQMAVKAQASASPQTPRGGKTLTNGLGSPLRTKMDSPAGLNRTPSRRSKRGDESPMAVTRTPSRRSKSGPLTPIPQRLTGPAPREHAKAELSTPYRLRKRNPVSMTDRDSSGSDDSLEESTSGEEDEELDSRNTSVKPESKAKDSDMVASAEAYFDIHSMNQVTSDRTLASLDMPRMDVQAIRLALKDVKTRHVKEAGALFESHKAQFDRWMLNMCQDYNILTYGLGSKQSLLEAFRQSHLKPFSHLVINGYFPSLTVKHILNAITEEIIEDSRSFPNLFAQIEFIGDFFKKNDEDFFLVIHNVDGVLVRSKKCQNILSLLASMRGIHIIASVDHINASFLWDEIQFFRFRWLWYDTTTFQPYEAENSYENSLMVQQSGGLALSSIIHVMKSLTPNAKRIFLILAEFQLDAGNSANYEGMSFQALYQKCREDFLVNSDLTLQAQLVEFKDHRLIRAKKNFEGVELLLIPIDKSTLKVFLDEHRDDK